MVDTTLPKLHSEGSLPIYGLAGRVWVECFFQIHQLNQYVVSYCGHSAVA